MEELKKEIEELKARVEKLEAKANKKKEEKPKPSQRTFESDRQAEQEMLKNTPKKVLEEERKKLRKEYELD